MRDLYSNFGFYRAIDPVLHDEADAAAITGVTIDTRGYEGITFVVQTGLVESMTTSTTSYFCFRIQHTDASALGLGASDFADVSNCKHIIHSVLAKDSADLTSGIWQNYVNGTDHASMVYMIGYIGPKRYARIVMSGTADSAASINIGAMAFKGLPGDWPISTPA